MTFQNDIINGFKMLCKGISFLFNAWIKKTLIITRKISITWKNLNSDQENLEINWKNLDNKTMYHIQDISHYLNPKI